LVRLQPPPTAIDIIIADGDIMGTIFDMMVLTCEFSSATAANLLSSHWILAVGIVLALLMRVQYLKLPGMNVVPKTPHRPLDLKKRFTYNDHLWGLHATKVNKS
jgi:hypothetical protein